MLEVELHIPSFAIAKEFYQALGFHIQWEREANGAEGYLVMTNGDSVLSFWPGTDSVTDNEYFSRFDPGTKRGFGVEIVVHTDALNETYLAAETLRCVVEPLKEQPWGQRDFRIEDPFGFYIRFTSPFNALDFAE